MCFAKVEAATVTKDLCLAFLDAAATKLARMVSEWYRVGFCQGNFNADNCLVGGYTMDYGPFGFMDMYDPGFAKWTGSGTHFAFANQMNAGFVNWQTLVNAVEPALQAAGGTKADLNECVVRNEKSFKGALDNCWRRKLGFQNIDPRQHAVKSWLEDDDEPEPPMGSFRIAPNQVTKIPEDQRKALELAAYINHSAADLNSGLSKLMLSSEADYTITYRQLAVVVESFYDIADDAGPSDLVDPLREAFHSLEPPVEEWAMWIRQWITMLKEHHPEDNGSTIAARMRGENPKYIPREWMLVEVYDAVAAGDFAPLHEIFDLFSQPYAEQTPERSKRFYTRASTEDLKKPGTAFMT